MRFIKVGDRVQLKGNRAEAYNLGRGPYVVESTSKDVTYERTWVYLRDMPGSFRATDFIAAK